MTAGSLNHAQLFDRCGWDAGSLPDDLDDHLYYYIPGKTEHQERRLMDDILVSNPIDLMNLERK